MKTTALFFFLSLSSSACITLTEHQKAIEARDEKVMKTFERFGQIYREAPQAEPSQSGPPQPAAKTLPQQEGLQPVPQAPAAAVPQRDSRQPLSAAKQSRPQRVRVIDADELRVLGGLLKQVPKQDEPVLETDDSSDDHEVVVVVQRKPR